MNIVCFVGVDGVQILGRPQDVIADLDIVAAAHVAGLASGAYWIVWPEGKNSDAPILAFKQWLA